MPGRTKEELARLFRANLSMDPAAAVRSARLCGMTDTELLDELAKVPKAERANGRLPQETSRLKIVAGSDVRREHLDFLWEPYLPLGRLIHFGGAPSQGKSPVVVDLAARVTRGEKWPDGQQSSFAPRSVLMMNIEDDAHDTILPRFDLAGGDDGRLLYVEGTELARGDKKADVMVALDRDMHLLADTARGIEELGLIIIDPITNYLGKLNMNREEEVRTVLAPLALLARELKICVITVGHFNRRERGTDPLGRVMGASAFVGVARAVYVFGPDPDAESPYSHIMSPARGAVGDDSLKYHTEIVRREWEGRTSKVVRVAWDGATKATAEDAVDPMSRADKGQLADASKLLREFLKTGRKPADECLAMLKAAGVDVDKVNPTRARKKIGAGSEQRDRRWWWFLQGGSDELF